MAKSSEYPGFYKLSPEERLKFVGEFADLSKDDLKILSTPGSLGIEKADGMIENVIGVMELPLGVAVNFIINGIQTCLVKYKSQFEEIFVSLGPSRGQFI